MMLFYAATHKGFWLIDDLLRKGENVVAERALNLTLPAIPPRSRLYHLEPIGLRTPYVESLTSYFIRLAAKHSVSSISLYTSELQPIIRNISSIKQISKGRKGITISLGNISRPVNGLTIIAKVWVSTIESLTLRRELCYLTTLLWEGVISSERMLRTSPAWCPCCYKDWRQEGKVIYEPLLWMIAPITVCPSHRRRLIDICSSCNDRPGFITAYKISGHCSRCGEWLGLDDHDVTESPQTDEQVNLKHELWCADTICEWFEVAPSSNFIPTKDNLREAIKYCIEKTAGGNPSAFARLVGVNAQTVINWNSGATKPGFTGLLKVCSALQVSLTDLLKFNIQNYGLCSTVAGLGGVRQEALTSRGRNPQYVQNVLSDALKEIPSPSLSELANRMRYKTISYLCEKYPELCQRISDNYIAFMKEQGKVPLPRRKYDLKAVEESLVAILKQDNPSSILQISRDLNVCSVVIRKRFAKICRKIIAKREKCKMRRQLVIKRDMENALKENPPPALKKVLRRNGIGHRKMVNKFLSEICDAISTRYLRWKKAVNDEVGFNLQSALNEDPPPSLTSLAKRNGYNIHTLYKRYRELAQLVSARFIQYRKLCAERKRELLKQHVRKVMVELCQQGLYPSQKRVTPLLDIKERGNWLGIGAAIRQLRMELGIRKHAL